MAGEQNGTRCLLFRNDGVDDKVLVGQMELTHTLGGAPIEISNKSLGDYITYLNGELSTKGRTVAGTLIYSNADEFRTLRTQSMGGEIVEYMLDFTGIEADEVRFYGIPHSPNDTLPQGDKVTTSITISSVGEDL